MRWEEMTPRQRDALVAEKVMDITFFWEDPYTRSYEKTRQVEDKIERDGLQSQYIDALAMITEAMPFDDVLWPWAMIRATPDQRCLAALRAKGVNI